MRFFLTPTCNALPSCILSLLFAIFLQTNESIIIRKRSMSRFSILLINVAIHYWQISQSFLRGNQSIEKGVAVAGNNEVRPLKFTMNIHSLYMTLHFNASRSVCIRYQLSSTTMSSVEGVEAISDVFLPLHLLTAFENRKCRLLLIDSVTRSLLSSYHLENELKWNSSEV